MKAIKLFASGLVEVTTLPEAEHTFERMQKAIGCDLVDIQSCALEQLKDYCLVFDEEFLLKEKPVINPVASYFYGLQHHGQPLCGNVLIMKDKFTDEGLETTGLDDDDIDFLLQVLTDSFIPAIKATTNFLKNFNK